MSDPAIPHLILAGVTRAATTALFDWLAVHPQVCRASIKETRFFLDPAHGLRRLHDYRAGLAAYERFFTAARPGQVRLDATPDYLFDAGAAARIAGALPEARVVVILREPISRLISWYRFARQNGELPAGMSLDGFVEAQLEATGPVESRPQPMRAVAQGRYSAYLPAWIEAFGDRLLVLNHAAVGQDPVWVMRRVCALAGLDASRYEGFDFGVVNAATDAARPGARRALRGLVWKLKPWVHDRPALRRPLRWIRRRVEPWTTGSATAATAPRRADTTPPTMSEAIRRRVEAYYRDEPARLAELFGLPGWDWEANDFMAAEAASAADAIAAKTSVSDEPIERGVSA